jgi:hypothetical protein
MFIPVGVALPTATRTQSPEDRLALAQSLMVLVDGTVTQILLHRNSSCAHAVAPAARALLK